ncbi:MAG: leucyl/phenylalanyl-tRNA--protein transferase [Acidobacteriota bacterium]|nr:leucyl/phenylalanyl-tRNA--protein transferase [Acidobacteriota bacterium]
MISLQVLLTAYRSGLFPMPGPSGTMVWHAPDPRGILPIGRFRVSRRLARVLRSHKFDITFDRAFHQVIIGCASRGAEGDWINGEIIETYSALHEAGFAHSVEVWHGGELAGGLYGVALGGAFVGESMFYRVTDASKVALSALIDRLRTREFRLLDVQWLTPHLARLGAVEVPRVHYLELLEDAMQVDPGFGTGQGVCDERGAPSNQGRFMSEVGSKSSQPAK